MVNRAASEKITHSYLPIVPPQKIYISLKFNFDQKHGANKHTELFTHAHTMYMYVMYTVMLCTMAHVTVC